MEQTELAQGTTARAAAFGPTGNDEALTRVMAPNLPGGIASTHLRERRPQSPSSYRLLDSRILAFGLQFLDQDVSGPLMSGLSKYRALVAAANESRADPRQAEVIVNLIDPYEITSKQSPYVALEVDNSEIARVGFDLTMVFGMFQTAVAIRRGAIESVLCEACSFTITLSLTGWQPPLLHKKVQLPVRLPVRPPRPIPLPDRA